MAKKARAGSPDPPPARFNKTDTTRFNAMAGWAALVCAAFIAYQPALSGSLLWDDNAHITRPDLQSWHGLWRIWFDLGATQQYYPLLHSAFWLEHRIWGDAFPGYHLLNVALHSVAACLVVAIVRRLSLRGAWLAGFLFALHPVCVEAVAWISEQKSTLSGVFCLAALLVYLRFDADRKRNHYLVATALFVLALMSKTVTATLPAVLLVIFWWQRGTLSWRRDVLPLIPWLAIGAGAGLFTSYVEKNYVGAHGANYVLTPAERFLIAGRALWFYAGKLVWPSNLTFSYPHWKLDPADPGQWLFPAGVVAVAIVLLWIARRRNERGPLASFLIFAGTLFPVLGFLDVYPFRYSYVADHFQYLASLAIIIPVAALLARIARQKKLSHSVTVTCAAVLVLAAGAATWQQSRMYGGDVEALYRETLRRNPGSYMAHNNLGDMLLEQPGRLQEAIGELEAAIVASPDDPEGHNNLATALRNVPSRQPETLSEYQTAIRLKPDYAEAHNNLAIALSRYSDKQQDAIAEFRTALSINPKFAEAHKGLADSLLHTPGREEDALTEFRAAIRLKPDYADAHNDLGYTLAQMGRLPEAIAEYRKALRIQPDLLTARANLGNALLQNGQAQEAVAEYRAALRFRPDMGLLHYRLGSALAMVPGQESAAQAEFAEAQRLSPGLAAAGK
jgi:tetratricopeptide (TPR) repeat protein